MNNVIIVSSISYCAHVRVGITENFLIDDNTEYSPLHITAAAGLQCTCKWLIFVKYANKFVATKINFDTSTNWNAAIKQRND